MLRRLLVIAFLLPISWAAADEHDARFLAGLRQRRLFELAERYCRERLARSPLSETDRVDFTRELIRTLALHAANSPTAERDARWQAARGAAQQFAQDHPKHPRRALVQFQDALTLLLQGELLQEELATASEGAAAKALPSLREAVRKLTDLDKQLDAEILARHKQPPAAGDFSATELADLQQQVRQQQARALRSQGLCYPEKDDSRISLILQAADQLKKSLTRLAPDDPRSAVLQLDLAICYRHLRQAAEAGLLLEGLDLDGVSSSTRLHAQAERVRWLLLASDLPGAEKLLQQPRAAGASPDLDFAQLELAAAQWRKALSADDAAAADRLQKQSLDTARYLEETYGDAWGRRANQWLVKHAPRSAAAGAELLGKAADQLYLQGQLEEAVAAYDEAAAQAAVSQDATAAFELGYKAALVEQKRKQHGAAAQRLRQLALDHKSLPTAAEAHRQAAWNLAQALRSDSLPTADYAALLAEHLATWPQGESADQVRLWLGRLKESEEAWSDALVAYRGVPRESQHFAAALAGAIRAGQRQLEALQAGEMPTEAASREAILYYQQAIAGNSDQLPQKWSELEGQAAVAAAQMVLGYRTTGYDAAETLLSAALEGLPDAPAAWRQEAQSLLVAALAVQPGKKAAAEKLLASLGDTTPQTMLALLDTLTLIARRSRPDAARQIAALQLQAVDRLEPQRTKLDASIQGRLQRVRAECLVSTGKQDEALVLYGQLAPRFPQDGDLQEGYAALLSARKDKSSLEKGLEQWRRVAAKSQPRTPRWWRAKYGIALAQSQLGDKKSAAVLIRYLTEVPPGLEGCELKDQFLTLLRRCEG